MIPTNGSAKFFIRSTSLTPGGVSVNDDERTVTMRACVSRPKRWTEDPALSEIDQTREWANLRLETYPPEFQGAGDIRVEWTPDGTTDAEFWDIDRVNQPVSVGGRVISCKLTIGRAKLGVIDAPW